jgi:hypothetical protein
VTPAGVVGAACVAGTARVATLGQPEEGAPHCGRSASVDEGAADEDGAVVVDDDEAVEGNEAVEEEEEPAATSDGESAPKTGVGRGAL